jgi:transcriptional regulator with PAS, ATPase and Fis domain
VSPLTDLIFVTKSRETYDVFDRQLKAFLPRDVSVKGFSLDAVKSVDCRKAKVVLLSSADCRTVLRLGNSNPKVLISRRTLDPSKLGPLFTLEPGTDVLVVNNAEDVAKETARLIAAFGLDMLNLIPWWPGALRLKPRPSIAVTPGLPGIVPGFIATVYDVGIRPIDASSLVELGLALGISLDGITEENASNYQGVVRVIREQADLLKRVDAARADLEAILDSVHDAVIMCDEDLRINTLNSTAASVLGLGRSTGVGRSLTEWFPADVMRRVLRTGVAETDRVQKIKGKRYVVSFRSTSQGTGQRLIVTAQESRAVEHARGALVRAMSDRNRVARYVFEDIIGRSPAMEKAIRSARRLAMSSTNVFIQGETGTGKELFAHAIHNASPMRNGPFVAHNIAALPEQLVQSELFGYESGAFTGARREGKVGLFELADKGTLFLDEIADMSPSVQVSLLRVLQEREITRVGGSDLIPVNVRVIAASNQDLSGAVREGRFRRDLYYRLCAFPLRIPPLRERPEDIPLLLEHFVMKYMKRPVHVDPVIIKKMMSWVWPGNVRELEEMVRYAASMADDAGDFVAYLDRLIPKEGRVAWDVPALPEANRLNRRAPSRGEGAGGLPPDSAEDTALTLIESSVRRDELVAVLKAIGQNPRNSAGRATVARVLAANGLGLTPGQVRQRLRYLTEIGLVRAGRGRRGSTLTDLGLKIVRRYIAG